ncbi:hypothetical protein GCM10009422_28840 [Brevundimonas kwangchunensis]|uniref:Uncharacterized protein n=1 Tax=Brevundimonas kwangchunensis TaxID=322163 RepID=A0ABP3SDG9_9CAUL
MRELPIKLPPVRLERRGSVVREIFYFAVAFVALFGGAVLAFEVLF